MLEELTDDAIDTQIDDIELAADILRRMLQELRGLEVNCARLHFAMSTSGHTIRQQVDMLSGIAELLKSRQAPLRTRELHQRAKRLILQLATELEQLSLHTEQELRMDHLASLPYLPTRSL